jgi:fructose-specific component phosphotransferase system IIB-like protein
MCFGGDGGAAAAAAQAARAQRKAEDKRQTDIRAGQAGIDTAFSQFDPAYYDKFKSAYTDNYNPQIADQYGVAKDKLVATLAGRGTLESTVGANKFAQLGKTKTNAEADIGASSTDAANALKEKVEGAKTNLYTLNQAAADPQGIATQAIGQATSIAAPRALSPLGDVFAGLLSSAGAYNKADATSLAPRLSWNQNAGFAPITGVGSSLSVR